MESIQPSLHTVQSTLHHFVERLRHFSHFPPVDVYEQGEHLIVEVELPGVSPQAVSLQFQQNLLRISVQPPGQEETGRRFGTAARAGKPGRVAVTLYPCEEQGLAGATSTRCASCPGLGECGLGTPLSKPGSGRGAAFRTGDLGVVPCTSVRNSRPRGKSWSQTDHQKPSEWFIGHLTR